MGVGSANFDFASAWRSRGSRLKESKVTTVGALDVSGVVLGTSTVGASLLSSLRFIVCCLGQDELV